MCRRIEGGSARPGGIRRIVVRPSPVGRWRATVQVGCLVFPAAIGRGGITACKREGDGATPRTAMRLEFGFFRGDRLSIPSSRLPMRPARRAMGWCDAPAHSCYNRLVRLPFAASHESLMREDPLYDICLVMDWNRRSRRRNCGSAIFFHVARAGYAPTEGCVAVSRRALRLLLAHVGPKTVVVVT